jgi:hypothetical protein
MKKLFLTAFLAALGLAAPAMAQVSANLGDLILGFRATGGQGQNVNLEVNLGSVAQFQGQAAGTTLLISRLSAADLAATYGAGWATRTDLFWGIIGTAGRISGGPGGSPVGTLWATNAEPVGGTQSVVWTPGSRGAHFNASSVIEAVLLGSPGSLNGVAATKNSATSAAVNATLPGSFGYQDTFQPGVSFAFFNPSIDNSVKANGSGFAVSDLYEVQTGAATSTYLGSFGLSADGNLTFSTSPSFFGGGSSTLPVITAPPVAQTVQPGANTTLSVTATGTGLTYQWLKDGVAIAGATSSTYTITSATAANAGNYSVTVTNAAKQSITSAGIPVVVGNGSNPGRLINLSVNTTIAAGESFSLGFVVGGVGTGGNKPLLMRAGGPSLTQFGLPAASVLADPSMVFYNGTTKISQNAGWAGDSTILQTAASVGAYAYAGSTSKDSAIYLSAVPLGNDSVVVRGGSATSAGTVIAELYDATPSSQFGSTTPRLVNVSVLKSVGQFITVGFVVGGSNNVRVLIRGIGPTVGSFGVAGAIADPKMSLFSGQTVIASNDDWGTPVGATAATAAQLNDAFSKVGAFVLPAGSKDSALLVSLAPGAYTAQVSASTGVTGVGLVEVYEVP